MSFDSTMVGLVVFSIVMHSSVQLFAERFYGLAYSSSPCRAIFLAVPLPTLTGCFILSVPYVPFCRRIRCPGLSMTWFYIMNILVLMFQCSFVGFCRGAYHTANAAYFGVMSFCWYVTYVLLSVHSVR